MILTMKNMILANKILKKEINELNLITKKIFLSKNDNFLKLCENSLNSLKSGGKILLFGNGGSAADAQHLATELTVRYSKKRKAIAALALTTDTSALTAIGNDLNFKFIFSRQIEALGKNNDTVIAITTSGKSKNIIEGIKKAKKMGIKTFCFSGCGGGIVKKYSDYTILIPSSKTSIIQTVEILLGQVLCDFLERKLSKD